MKKIIRISIITCLLVACNLSTPMMSRAIAQNIFKNYSGELEIIRPPEPQEMFVGQTVVIMMELSGTSISNVRVFRGKTEIEPTSKFLFSYGYYGNNSYIFYFKIK